MATMIVVFGVLALLHFIYEGILAPSLRLSVRYDLFKLRDDIRSLKEKHRDEIDDKHFHYLQDGANNAIRLLPFIDMFFIVRVQHELQRNKELRGRMEERSKILDDCRVEEAKELRRKGNHLTLAALGINCGGWTFYLAPVFFAMACYENVRRVIRATTALSEPDLQKASPIKIDSFKLAA